MWVKFSHTKCKSCHHIGQGCAVVPKSGGADLYMGPAITGACLSLHNASVFFQDDALNYRSSTIVFDFGYEVLHKNRQRRGCFVYYIIANIYEVRYLLFSTSYCMSFRKVQGCDVHYLRNRVLVVRESIEVAFDSAAVGCFIQGLQDGEDGTRHE